MANRSTAGLVIAVCTAISILNGFLIGHTEATLNLEISLVRYRNPNSDACSRNCDLLAGLCDNMFTFCLHTTETSNCTYVISSTRAIGNDDFFFTSTILSHIGLSDPIVFRSISPTAPLELEVRIIDDDGIFSADDLVDVINIDFPRTLNLSATYSNTTTYQGACRNSDKTLDLQYRITSNCPENQYGPNCLTNCIPQVGQYYCNYLGGRVCHDNYYTSDCSVFCVPTSEQICNEDGMLVDRASITIAIGVSVSVGSLLVISVAMCVVCCCCCHCKKKRHSIHSSTDPIKVQLGTSVVVSTTASAPPLQNTVAEYPMQAYPTAPQQHYPGQQSAPQHGYSTLQGSAYPTQLQQLPQGYPDQSHASASYPILHRQALLAPPYPAVYNSMQQQPPVAEVAVYSSFQPAPGSYPP